MKIGLWSDCHNKVLAVWEQIQKENEASKDRIPTSKADDEQISFLINVPNKTGGKANVQCKNTVA